MPYYRLYKNDKVINIIKSDIGHVEHLVKLGEIDSFIDIATDDFIYPMKRTKKGNFEINEERIIPTELASVEVLKAEDAMKEVEVLKEKISNLEKQSTQQINDVNSAILAIKGFMMEIPNIQKSLLELKDMVQPK